MLLRNFGDFGALSNSDKPSTHSSASSVPVCFKGFGFQSRRFWHSWQFWQYQDSSASFFPLCLSVLLPMTAMSAITCDSDDSRYLRFLSPLCFKGFGLTSIQ